MQTTPLGPTGGEDLLDGGNDRIHALIGRACRVIGRILSS